METPDDWNRRRFLALTGGMTVLAGCAAEEIDDTEDADDEDDDVDEETDDEGDDVETDDDINEDGEVDDPDEEADGEDDEDDSEESNGEAEGDDTPDDAESEDGEDDHEGTDDSGEGEADSDETDDSGEDHTDEGETDEESDGEDESDGEVDDGDEDDEGEDQTGDGDDEEDDTSDDEPEEPPLSDISIRVVDPDGEPIEGATVSGEGDPHEADIDLVFDGETGDSGYHHNTIYENEYTIEINHSDYESTTIDHTHDGETEVSVELEPEDPPVSEITITVVDTDGEPVEGAMITGNGESHPADIPLIFDGETDEDGVLSTPIYENEYRLSITHPYYSGETVYHTHDGETEVTVEITRTVEEVQLTLTITDPDDEPIEGASIVGEGNPGGETVEFSGETDSDGQYSTVLLQDTYQIEIDHPEYQFKDLYLPLREDTDVTFELDPENENDE